MAKTITKKAADIIDRIRAEMLELQKETELPHISAFIIDGNFSFTAYTEDKKARITIFKEAEK